MGTMTIAITIIAISAIAGCGILANSLRHRNGELNDATINYSKLLSEKEKVEVLLDKARTLVSDLENSNKGLLEQRDEWKSQAYRVAEKLRNAHQRHPKTKALLPMGTNPDGTNV